MLKKDRVKKQTSANKILRVVCLIMLAIFLLSGCGTTISETDTTEADRDFLDQLIRDTESEPIEDSEPNETDAISNVVIDTEADIATTEEPETTEKSPETTKKIEETTKKPEETTKKVEETTKKSEETTKKVDSSNSTMVWIPTKGGKKYHKSSGCSNMDDPQYVTLSEAKNLGFTACKRCYK